MILKSQTKLNNRKVERTLSEELTELLDESRCLLDLKAAWGRMPEGPVKSLALLKIEQWFQGPETAMRKGPSDLRKIGSSAAPASSHEPLGFIANCDRSREEEGVTPPSPDDDDIPF